MAVNWNIKGAPSALNIGMQGILESGEAPDTYVSWGASRRRRKGATRKGDGEYVSCLAEYSGDPNAFCSTRHEAEERLKASELDYERT